LARLCSPVSLVDVEKFSGEHLTSGFRTTRFYPLDSSKTLAKIFLASASVGKVEVNTDEIDSSDNQLLLKAILQTLWTEMSQETQLVLQNKRRGRKRTKKIQQKTRHIAQSMSLMQSLCAKAVWNTCINDKCNKKIL
jgi:hypothetical protein